MVKIEGNIVKKATSYRRQFYMEARWCFCVFAFVVFFVFVLFLFGFGFGFGFGFVTD